MKITYWSDYACPFCYIGDANLFKALKNMGLLGKVETEMRAFELDSTEVKENDVDPVKRLSKKYGISEEVALERIAKINKAGHDAGLDMHADRVKRANTFDALRLTKYAQSLGDEMVTDKLIKLLFKAVFTDSEVISDHKVLIRIAQEAGLTDMAKVEKVLKSSQFAMDVRNDERDAHIQGVRGVPYYVIGNYVMPGAYPVEEIEKILKHEFDADEKLKAESKGVVCDAAGCHIK